VYQIAQQKFNRITGRISGFTFNHEKHEIYEKKNHQKTTKGTSSLCSSFTFSHEKHEMHEKKTTANGTKDAQ
jgi:hypothetical protein